MRATVDRCKTAADVWAAVHAVRERRLKMFAPEQPKEVQQAIKWTLPEPIKVPNVIPIYRWTGSQWHGDLRQLSVLAYPCSYEPLKLSRELSFGYRPTVDKVQRIVSNISGVKLAELKGPERTATIVMARQVAMAIAKRFSIRSLPAIGRYFGNRDHTTVLHAVRKMQPVMDAVERMLPEAADLADWVREALAFAHADNLETAHARRERLRRLKTPLMVAAE